MNTGDYLTATGLFVGAIGLILVIHQTILLIRQSQIIDKQDEILNRRATLLLVVNWRPILGAPDSQVTMMQVDFRIRNDGKKSARDYYWHLYVPMSVVHELLTEKKAEFERGIVTRDATKYRYYSSYVNNPIYPTRGSIILAMKMRKPFDAKPVRLLWQVVAEDGVFPGEDPGSLEISLA